MKKIEQRGCSCEFTYVSNNKVTTFLAFVSPRLHIVLYMTRIEKPEDSAQILPELLK